MRVYVGLIAFIHQVNFNPPLSVLIIKTADKLPTLGDIRVLDNPYRGHIAVSQRSSVSIHCVHITITVTITTTIKLTLV